MIAAIRQSLSAVSLLLLAGTGLIIAEGPLAQAPPLANIAPPVGGLSPVKGTHRAPAASVSVIYGATASGHAHTLKVTSTTTPPRSVVHENGSVTTTDRTVAADKP